MDTSSTSTSYTQDVVDYDDDRNLDEVFRMYGIKAALDNSNSNDDCQSEGSDDLEERLNSRLFVVRASASFCGKIQTQDECVSSMIETTNAAGTSTIILAAMSIKGGVMKCGMGVGEIEQLVSTWAIRALCITRLKRRRYHNKA